MIKDGALSPETMEAFLLHEMGHHNYPQANKTENQMRAQVVLNSKSKIDKKIQKGLSGIIYPLMAANAYQILRYKPNITMLTAQFLATQARQAAPTLTETYVTKKAQYTAKRPEEIFADQFSAKHASTKALQAADKEFYSLQGSLKVQQAFNKEPSPEKAQGSYERAGTNIDNWCLTMLQKLKYSSSAVHDFFDPAHPCHKDRSAMIKEELNRRSLDSLKKD